MPPDPLALAILFLSTLSLRRATQITVMQATDAMPFLSTLSLRRATIPCGYFVTPIVFLSTLSLRRATGTMGVPQPREAISIHALLAESDPGIQRLVALLRQFLSTLSLRRATITEGSICFDSSISIHALLAESDRCFRCCAISCITISIHALLAESDASLI